MYLDRDIPNPIQEKSESDDPVEVSNLFKIHIHYALEVAKSRCQELSENNSLNKSEVDFWCDMVDDLKQIEFDILLVSEKEMK